MSFDLSLLGVKKNIPSVNFTDYSGIFQAPPKFGKTTLATMLPNSIIVPFEDGVKGSVANVVQNIKKWEDFIEFIDKLEDNREAIGSSIKTIVFDTINQAYEMLTPYTLRSAGKLDGCIYRTVGDTMGGKTNFWVERDRLLKIQIDRIFKLGFVPFFITHLEVKTIKPKKAEPYDVYKSTMPDRLENLIYPLVDFIITGERRVLTSEDGKVDEKRVLLTRGSNMAVAGNRVAIDKEIVFDTESEAMEKYQEEFRKSIERKLELAGIKESIEDIGARQEKEKIEKAVGSISESKIEKIIEEVDTIIKALSPEDKVAIVSKLKKEKAFVEKYKDETDVKKLEKMLEIMKQQ